MDFKKIDIRSFISRTINIWKNQWFLLTSGNFREKKYNSMTVAWGSIGYMWNLPFVQVVVRPAHYTFSFMEDYDTFSLCAFSEQYKDKLNLLGSLSGRDSDKIAKSGLTLVASQNIEAPIYLEADLVIESRKIYWDDFKPAHFLKQEIHKNYAKKDYHRIYFGEIISIYGIEKYQSHL